MRILFTGGGTGGHIYPLIATKEALQKIALSNAAKQEWRRQVALRLETDFNFYYAGAAGNFEPLLAANGIKTRKIWPAKLRHYFDFRNVLDFFIFPASILQALWKVFCIMPDVLFSKSGPGSLPVVIACWFYRVPIIIHESDVIMGLANRLAIPFASAIALSWESAAQNLLESRPKRKEEGLRSKIAVVGNPVRELKTRLTKTEAKDKFGFDKNLPLILVLGGSQGAIKINDFMFSVAHDLVKKKIQVLHQTGPDNFGEAESELKIILRGLRDEEKKYYQIAPYFENNLADAYQAADLLLARASSGVIFEAAAADCPAILIPLPTDVVGLHQIKNGYEYSQTGAALVLEEENLTSHLFLTTLDKILQPEKLSQMSAAAKKFSRPEAGKAIAEEIIELAKR